MANHSQAHGATAASATPRATMAEGLTQAEMSFDFDGLIQLLAEHLYSEKKVFIRELIQNAHDAIQRRATMPWACTSISANKMRIGR